MKTNKSQIIRLVCDADFTSKREWAKKFRNRTIDELIQLYNESENNTQ